jgi:hypothetical protein
MLRKIKTPVATTVPIQIQSKFSLLNLSYEIQQVASVFNIDKFFGQGSGKFLAAGIAHGLLPAPRSKNMNITSERVIIWTTLSGKTSAAVEPMRKAARIFTEVITPSLLTPFANYALVPYQFLASASKPCVHHR